MCALHVHIICECQCMYTCVNLQVCVVCAWAMVVCVHVHKYTVCMMCIPACGVQYICNSSLPFFPQACECYRYSRLQLSHQLLECTTTKLQFYSFMNNIFGTYHFTLQLMLFNDKLLLQMLTHKNRDKYILHAVKLEENLSLSKLNKTV